MAAALSGSIDIVKLLVINNAHVNAQDKFSWTPLMIASRSGHSDIVHVLLDAGADQTVKDDQNRSVIDIYNMKKYLCFSYDYFLVEIF